MRDHIHFLPPFPSCSTHPTTSDRFSSSILKMLTRGSVLGKRGHQVSSVPVSSVESCEQLQTPDSTPNPKRARTTSSVEDGDANKENIPPFQLGSVTVPTTPRSARAMRRHATSAEVVTPTRARPGISLSWHSTFHLTKLVF